MWEAPIAKCEKLLDKGQGQNAELVARDALEIVRGIYGERADETARCYATLGQVLLAVGKPKDAADAFSDALRTWKRDPLAIARAAAMLDFLGEAFEQLGKPRRARSAFERALTLREHAFGPRDPDVARSLEHLAHFASKELGDDRAAEHLLLRARAILDDAPGRVDELCDALHQLGAVYLHEGKLLDAQQTFERALRLKAQNLGWNHPDLWKPIRDLGMASARSGELRAAEIFLRRAIELRRKAAPGDHPDVTALEAQLRDVLLSAARMVNESTPPIA